MNNNEYINQRIDRLAQTNSELNQLLNESNLSPFTKHLIREQVIHVSALIKEQYNLLKET